VSADVEGDFVRVSVRDTGRGVAQADLAQIFDQFFQAKQGDEVSRNGLGLGLFVSRDLIVRQGGDMTAESVLGRGTTISFTLPMVGRPATVEVSV
jgi:signal transduction histidine kinase